MFKIDTKEKFKVLTPEAQHLSANMTENMRQSLLDHLHHPLPNLVLNLKTVASMSPEISEMMAEVQQEFYDKGYSFVICELNETLEEELDKAGLLEILNTTPTESEAWDIVQMEEIEREFLKDDDSQTQEQQ